MKSVGKCLVCGREERAIAGVLELCRDCIVDRFDSCRERIRSVHIQTRQDFNLPAAPPEAADGVECRFCVNRCRIAPGEYGYCTVQEAATDSDGTPRLKAHDGRVSWYYDRLPTNCVASWVCGEGETKDRPRFPPRNNLAVFYGTCCFNCLFCQNWHFRDSAHTPQQRSEESFLEAVQEHVACICYFGGDPTTQMEHSLRVSRQALRRRGGQALRICWETNGSMSRGVLRQAAELSTESGGCIKFDLKAWNEQLHIALTGTTNSQTLENFSWLAEKHRERPNPPLLIASTLLVPGYIGISEVRSIARFIAGYDPTIPYSLLGFHPDFFFSDLPTTSQEHAQACQEAALEQGLQKVHIGNRHLLSRERYKFH